MNELNRRNTETVEQALKDTTAQVFEQQIRINGLNNSMSSLMDRQNALEKMVYEMKVKLTGRGATILGGV